MSSWGWADWALLLTVATMGTVVAYLRNPEHKAFMLMLPVPFTFALLAVNKDLDATNILAMLATFGYTVGVWALRVRCRVPIVLEIAIAVAGYASIGVGMTKLHPTGNVIFWIATIVTWLASVALIRWLPYKEEPHHRTPLPVWIKFPVIALAIVGLIQIKRQLGGFTTGFPMVGIVVAYESRHSLWTNVRRMPWILAIVVPMEVTIWLLQPRVGMPVALALSWPVYLVGLWIFHTISKKAFEEEAD